MSSYKDYIEKLVNNEALDFGDAYPKNESSHEELFYFGVMSVKEIVSLRRRVANVDKALTRCITFLTNVNTITEDSQIELVKELINAGRADLADAVSIGGFGSAL